VFVALLVQMGLGELQWRAQLPWGLVLVHVFLAAAVWVGVVALTTLLFRPNVDFADR
jgi:heme A synthase